MVGDSKKNFLNFLNLIAKQIKTEVNVNIFQTIKKNLNEQLCCGNELKTKLNYKKTIKSNLIRKKIYKALCSTTVCFVGFTLLLKRNVR